MVHRAYVEPGCPMNYARQLVPCPKKHDAKEKK